MAKKKAKRTRRITRRKDPDKIRKALSRHIETAKAMLEQVEAMEDLKDSSGEIDVRGLSSLEKAGTNLDTAHLCFIKTITEMKRYAE